MRRFPDRAGRTWEAAIGRESWGTFVLLFTGEDGPRKAVLGAETQLDAQRELDALSDGQLRERLEGSQPWQ
jgi:hypothetical protein